MITEICILLNSFQFCIDIKSEMLRRCYGQKSNDNFIKKVRFTHDIYDKDDDSEKQ